MLVRTVYGGFTELGSMDSPGHCIVVPSEGKMPLGLSHHWCCCAQGPQLEVWEPLSCSQARDEHKYFTSINLPSWESEH